MNFSRQRDTPDQRVVALLINASHTLGIYHGGHLPRPVLRPAARAFALPRGHGAPARIPEVGAQGVVHLAMARTEGETGAVDEGIGRGTGAHGDKDCRAGEEGGVTGPRTEEPPLDQ